MLKFDLFRIYDSDESLIERAFCGKTVRTPIRSKANKLFVIFESDTSLEDQGFAARWRIEMRNIKNLFFSFEY